MPGSTQWTITADGILGIANSVAGLTGNCSQGYKRYADNQNWENTLVATPAEAVGYFGFNLKSIRQQELDMSGCRFEGELAVHVTKDGSSVLDAGWDMASALVAALKDRDMYPNGCLAPKQIECELYKIETVEAPGIAYFMLGRNGVGTMEYDSGD